MANKRLVTEIGETCIKVSEGEISINSPSSRSSARVFFCLFVFLLLEHESVSSCEGSKEPLSSLPRASHDCTHSLSLLCIVEIPN